MKRALETTGQFDARVHGMEVANKPSKMTSPVYTTMLDLVRNVSKAADSENEVISTVTYLVNSGKVVLIGNFAGKRIS